ncbi:MAG: hypothetical protein OEZ13_08635 [Spirochaetia bacterium]|nr:hypothetical protein [Spirochaetia bacterium]
MKKGFKNTLRNTKKIMKKGNFIAAVLLVASFTQCSVFEYEDLPYRDDHIPGQDLPVTKQSIHVEVTGIRSAALILQNGSDSLNVPADGAYTFSEKVTSGESYNVTLTVSPNGALNCAMNSNTGTMPTSDVTVIITCANNWTIVSAGDAHSLALRGDGSLWAWGNNENGQLGDGGTITETCSVYKCSTIPVKIGTATWIAIAAGNNHSLGIQSDGTLWAWGDNTYGQLGDTSITQRNAPVKIGGATWKSVSANGITGYGAHSLGIQSDDTLWAWGGNAYGQIGDNSNTQRNAPVKIGGATWKSASAGGVHSLGIQSDDTLWAWGSDMIGQIGNGATTGDQLAPVQIGGAAWLSASAGGLYSAGIQANGSLWTWGSDMSHELGDGAPTTGQTSPFEIDNPNTYSLIFAGSNHTLGIRSDGTLYAWGSNNYGALGLPNTIFSETAPVNTSTESWVIADMGASHSLAIRNDNTLWAWGYNVVGQVGDGTTNDSYTFVQIP